MDSKTASLILQLQIEDSTNLLSSYEGKGKGIEGVLTDTQLALQLYTEELERNATIISDRHMTRSLARACQSDGDILALSFSQEQREARDRQVAMRLGGLDVPLAIAGIEVVANGEELDDEVIKKLNALYISAAEEPLDSDSRSADDQEGQDDSKALVPYNSPSSPGKPLPATLTHNLGTSLTLTRHRVLQMGSITNLPGSKTTAPPAARPSPLTT